MDMGRKLGIWAPHPFLGRGAGSPSNTKSPGPRPISIPSGILIHPAIWPKQIWAENWGEAVPLQRRGGGSPSNTMWPGARPTCKPCLILIHPTVWPQYTNVTDRQTDRQNNCLIAQGLPFYKRSPKIELRTNCVYSKHCQFKLKNIQCVHHFVFNIFQTSVPFIDTVVNKVLRHSVSLVEIVVPS